MAGKAYTVTQLQPVPQMTVLPGNRNMKHLPLDSDGKRDWSFGLLSCFGECSKCCLACWCPCLVHAQNRRRLENLNTQGYPDPQRDEVVIGDSFIYGALDVVCHMGWLQVVQIGTRQNIRERYNIRGSSLVDCCAPFFCQSCDLVQGHRELKLEEDSFPASLMNASTINK